MPDVFEAPATLTRSHDAPPRDPDRPRSGFRYVATLAAMDVISMAVAQVGVISVLPDAFVPELVMIGACVTVATTMVIAAFAIAGLYRVEWPEVIREMKLIVWGSLGGLAWVPVFLLLNGVGAGSAFLILVVAWLSAVVMLGQSRAAIRYLAERRLDLPSYLDRMLDDRDLQEPTGRAWHESGSILSPVNLKRVVDVVFVLGLSILALPLCLLIMMAIVIESGAGFLYRQERLGLGGTVFDVLKFRTMCRDADTRLEEILAGDPDLREEYDVFHKLRQDPRITVVGRWLRRFSCDELPQVWNVLRGDMSVVGPRAYRPDEVPSMEGLEQKVVAVRPGLTGLWQVYGRNRLTFSQRVLIDDRYVSHASPWLDLHIIFRTLPVVLSGYGAS